MKRTFLFFIALAVIFLYGCGSTAPEKSLPSENEEESEIVETLATTTTTARTQKKHVETEPVAEVETTSLYDDYFEVYRKKVGFAHFSYVRDLAEKDTKYDVEIGSTSGESNDLITITDKSTGDHVTLIFFPINVNEPTKDWIETLSSVSYESEGKSVCASDNFHSYEITKLTTFVKEQGNTTVKNGIELKNFMFAEKTNEKKSNPAVTEEKDTTSESTATTKAAKKKKTTTPKPATTTTATTTESVTTTTTTTVETTTTTEKKSMSYVANTNTKKFHYPSCSNVEDIQAGNRWDFTGDRAELIAQGYQPCKRCNP